MTPCTQKDKIERLVKQMDGNGRPGLIETVNNIDGKVDGIMISVEALTKAVQDLGIFKAEFVGAQKQKSKTFQNTWVLVSGIVGICGIVITLILRSWN